MNTKLLQQLINWPNNFITGTEFKAILPGTDDARRGIIKRAVHEGYLERLKRDYYLIRQIPNKPTPNAFELAQFIYGPSYISFESSLSHHQWIPEQVMVTCSATVKQSKSFDTPIGTFSFEKTPNESFQLGVAYIKDANSIYLMAEPWKAIADMIYCRKKSWDTISDLMTDLRIEENSIDGHGLDLLGELSNRYPHQPTRQTLDTFLKELAQ